MRLHDEEILNCYDDGMAMTSYGCLLIFREIHGFGWLQAMDIF